MRASKSKIWKTGLGVGAVAIVAFAILLLSRREPTRVDLVQVDRGEVLEVIETEGVFRARTRETVTAFSEGELKRVSLKVGDPVSKGQTLTWLYWDAAYVPVRSPFAGVISKVFREAAGPIRRGEPIVEVVDPDTLEVMVELLTPDALRVRPGAEAVIEGWETENSEGNSAVIRAVVRRVSRAGYIKPSALGVEEERTEVVLDPVGRSSAGEVLNRLGDRFHARVSIEVRRFENVLRVPIGALVRSGSDWAVYRAQSGRARKVKVRLGLVGNKYAELKGGLELGNPVLVYPGDEVEDGVRIEALRGARDSRQ